MSSGSNERRAIVSYIGGRPSDVRVVVPLGQLSPVRVPTPQSEARARAKRKAKKRR